MSECQSCAELRVRLTVLQSEVRMVAARIGVELEPGRATMGRRDLLELVQDRLEFAVEDPVGA